MNNRIAFLATVAAMSLILGAADATAAVDAEQPGIFRGTGVGVGPSPWLVRAEGGLVGMHDNWLNVPGPEVGLTVGRDVVSRLSVELTGSAREPENDQRRSWSALAVARWVITANATSRHALTVAGGPFVEFGNVVHGTLPFAHTELAYVYRAPFGLTVLAGGGLNFALARSSYVTPPPPDCDTGGDSPSWCFDLGPDAQEIHAGDATVHMRLAVGWQF